MYANNLTPFKQLSVKKTFGVSLTGTMGNKHFIIRRLTSLILALAIASSSYSPIYASENSDDETEIETTSPFINKRNVLILILLGSAAFYYRGAICNIYNQYATEENIESARQFVVNDIARPTFESVAEQGPRIIREQLSAFIIDSIRNSIRPNL